jgi:hypothetical protein
MNERTTRRHGGIQKTETTVRQCLEKRERKIGTNKSMKTAPYAVFCLPNGSCVLAALSTKLRGCTEGAKARGELGESLHEPSPERAVRQHEPSPERADARESIGASKTTSC